MPDFVSKLNYLNFQTREKNIPLYLIIDEYDNFTNVVLNEQGNEVYHALTHASGFNIGWNISTSYQFNMMLGFSEEDVRTMLQYYKDAGQLPDNTDIEAMITEMKPWYDNYCFAEECLDRDPKMFNCDMVLMNDNIACKGMLGVHAMMEEQARDLGFHFIFIEHDLEDCRTVPRRDMRKCVNEYMSIVLNEQPLDPTLVDFDDSAAY